MKRIRTAILGGGLAGLSSAYHLGGQAAVYEAHTTLGGLCSQVRSEGFRFDAVPHVLHFQNASIRALVDQLVEGRLIQYSRRACVLSNGVLTRYPFQAHLHGLPSRVIEECLRGRLEAQGGHRADTQDFDHGTKVNANTDFHLWLATSFAPLVQGRHGSQNIARAGERVVSLVAVAMWRPKGGHDAVSQVLVERAVVQVRTAGDETHVVSSISQ